MNNSFFQGFSIKRKLSGLRFSKRISLYSGHPLSVFSYKHRMLKKIFVKKNKLFKKSFGLNHPLINFSLHKQIVLKKKNFKGFLNEVQLRTVSALPNKKRKYLPLLSFSFFLGLRKLLPLAFVKGNFGFLRSWAFSTAMSSAVLSKRNIKTFFNHIKSLRTSFFFLSLFKIGFLTDLSAFFKSSMSQLFSSFFWTLKLSYSSVLKRISFQVYNFKRKELSQVSALGAQSQLYSNFFKNVSSRKLVPQDLFTATSFHWHNPSRYWKLVNSFDYTKGRLVKNLVEQAALPVNPLVALRLKKKRAFLRKYRRPKSFKHRGKFSKFSSKFKSGVKFKTKVYGGKYKKVKKFFKKKKF